MVCSGCVRRNDNLRGKEAAVAGLKVRAKGFGWWKTLKIVLGGVSNESGINQGKGIGIEYPMSEVSELSQTTGADYEESSQQEYD